MLFEFYEDDNDTTWEVYLPVELDDYDPYEDPLSEPAIYAWYLVEE